jgi:hypothetical protein
MGLLNTGGLRDAWHLRYRRQQTMIKIADATGRDMTGLFAIAVPWDSGTVAPTVGMAAQALVEQQHSPLPH